MALSPVVSSPIFDRGLELVGTATPPVQIGTSDDYAPAQTPDQPALERVLALPNLDAYITDALRPRFDDWEILTPSGFQSALSTAVTQMRAAATRMPHAARALGRVAGLLVDEEELHDLLRHYRSALVQA